MISKDDISRLRGSVSDSVLMNQLAEQDPGFKKVVDAYNQKFSDSNAFSKLKAPSYLINRYYYGEYRPGKPSYSPVEVQNASIAGSIAQPLPAATPMFSTAPVEDASVGGFANNVLSSGINFIKGLGNAVMHPIQTAENVGKAALGGGINLAEVITQNEGLFNDPFGAETLASGVGKFYADRYGSIEAAKKTAYEDPVGFLADLATVVSAGGLAVQGAGKLAQIGTAAATAGQAAVPLDSAAAMIGRASGTVSKAGEAITAAGNAINPVNLAGKALSPVTNQLKKLPQRMIDSLIKPSKNEFKFGKDPGRAIVNEGIVASSMENLQSQVGNKLGSIGQKIKDTILARSSKSPPQTDISEIIDNAFAGPLDDAAKTKLSNPQAVTYLENLKQDLVREYGGTHVPLGVFEAKQGVSGLIKFDAADPFSGVKNQALWKVFEGLKEANNRNVPGLASLNERYAELAAAQASIQRRMAQIQRSNISGSVPAAGGIGAAFLTGDPVTGLATAGALKFAGSTPGKTIGAQAVRGANSVASAAAKAAAKTVAPERINSASKKK